jgi:hypothetical protein
MCISCCVLINYNFLFHYLDLNGPIYSLAITTLSNQTVACSVLIRNRDYCQNTPEFC